jgi:hypothetical protein
MTEQSYEVITSKEQAAKVKADLKADEHVKIWHHARAFTVTMAAEFANIAPAQGPGEASFSVRDDGQVDVFLYL